MLDDNELRADKYTRSGGGTVHVMTHLLSRIGAKGTSCASVKASRLRRFLVDSTTLAKSLRQRAVPT